MGIKSWKTTLFGVLSIISALASAGTAMLDGNPLTNPDWSLVTAAITAGLAAIMAKDKNVTGGSIQQ